MTTETRATLAELNATPARRERGQYTLETRIAVGRNGRSQRGRTGAKQHLLVMEIVVAERGEHVAGTYRVGQAFNSRGFCGGNGQHTGIPVAGLDTSAVTCEKCLARLVTR